MARTVDSFPCNPKKGRSAYSKYLDGQIWEIPLSDYPRHKHARGLAQTIRQTARVAGLKVRISGESHESDRIYVQAIKPQVRRVANAREEAAVQ